MSFIKEYFYNRKLKQLEGCLSEFKKDLNEDCQTEKLIRTKNGAPVYLVHRGTLENGQIYGGFVYAITEKGLIGSLNYTILRDTEQSIYIADIHYDLFNQGIGTQALQFLDEIALKISLKKITVWLSPLDLKNNRERLMHFYTKNGYHIAEEKDPKWNMRCLIASKFL